MRSGSPSYCLRPECADPRKGAAQFRNKECAPGLECRQKADRNGFMRSGSPSYCLRPERKQATGNVPAKQGKIFLLRGMMCADPRRGAAPFRNKNVLLVLNADKRQ